MVRNVLIVVLGIVLSGCRSPMRKDFRENICIGDSAGHNLTTGGHNIILGDFAGQEITRADYVLIIGSYKWKMTESEWQDLHKALIAIIEREKRFL